MSEPFVTATHAALFEEDRFPTCDICGEAIAPDEDEGPAVPGRAHYVSMRGDTLCHEEQPLCPGCAVAVGVTAIQRWDVEEDEG